MFCKVCYGNIIREMGILLGLLHSCLCHENIRYCTEHVYTYIVVGHPHSFTITITRTLSIHNRSITCPTCGNASASWVSASSPIQTSRSSLLHSSCLRRKHLLSLPATGPRPGPSPFAASQAIAPTSNLQTDQSGLRRRQYYQPNYGVHLSRRGF